MMKLVRFTALVAAGLAITYYVTFGLLYYSGFRVYRFPTRAMQPTIQKGELVFGKLSNDYRDRLERFDLAIFTVAQIPGQIFAKRIIGLPGEHIIVGDESVMINGRPLKLPGTVDSGGLGRKKCDLVIPADAVFVLGDYTSNSADSRYIGPILKREISGQLVFKK